MTEIWETASEWRIDLAQKLVTPYTVHPEVRMIVLGGSPTRGLSDEFSDLDIIVYWDVMDVDWLEQMHLERHGGRSVFLRKMSDDPTYIEEYYFETLKVDLGHGTMESWDRWVKAVVEDHDTNAGLQKSLAGFLDSIPLYGEELVAEWKERIEPYPEELGRKMLRENMGFFVKGYLLNQAYGRGDLLAYVDGVALTLKKLLGILAGLNKVYFSAEEPRWIEYELGEMPAKPERCWERMKTILSSDPHEAVPLLEELIGEVLMLAALRYPEYKLEGYLRRMSEAEVLACPGPPPIRRG